MNDVADSSEFNETQQQYIETYINVLLANYMDTVRSTVDAKSRTILLDTKFKEQAQQLQVLKDAFDQLNNSYRSALANYEASQIEIKNLQDENRLRRDEILKLCEYENKYKTLAKDYETVCNNYELVKKSHEELSTNLEKDDLKQTRSSKTRKVKVATPVKEDSEWT